MPQLPHAIELHDSILAAMRREGDTLVLELRPAYVHRDGAGWSQDADLRLAGAIDAAVPIDLPLAIWDGALDTPDGSFDGLLPVPLAISGPVRFACELVSGVCIDIAAGALRIELLGEARFIETLA